MAKRKLVTLNEEVKYLLGEVELEFRHKDGTFSHRQVEHNIVKIFMKECLSHRLPYSKIWDPEGGSDLQGAWVDSGIDPLEEFSAKYILLGASFDANGVPLDSNDPRYYVTDTVTGLKVPIRLEPGAYYDGELINAIPISEPYRPLKKIENIYFESTYQPAGTPLLQSDVRAINNILVLETTLRDNEYNGFGLTESDYFTITEVALAAGKTIDHVGSCNCVPRKIFLDGPYPAEASGSNVVTLNNSADAAHIKAGDQIKITGPHGSGSDGEHDIMGQVSPYYLVLSKSGTGKDLSLDRTPVDSHNVPITGSIYVWVDSLRICSMRVLSQPAKKSSDFQIIIRWRIIMS